MNRKKIMKYLNELKIFLIVNLNLPPYQNEYRNRQHYPTQCYTIRGTFPPILCHTNRIATRMKRDLSHRRQRSSHITALTRRVFPSQNLDSCHGIRKTKGQRKQMTRIR